MRKPLLALAFIPSIASATPFEFAVEPRTSATLYDQFSSSSALTGSTTKVMTMHLVLEQIALGKLALTDYVTMSDLAVGASCNCWPGGGTHYLSSGDYMTVDDALYGMAISTAEPTESLAELVANLDLYGTKATGSNYFESAMLRDHFIDMMNDEAAVLGLANTHYASVWGSKTNEWSTSRDLASVWVSGSNQSGFLTHMGVRTHAALVNQGGLWRIYNLGKGYGYFPNLVADKNGGWNDADTPNWECCIVAQTSRGGRTVVATVLNTDVAAPNPQADARINIVLRGAFATLMQPIAAGTGNQLAGGSSVGVAVSNNQAATSQVARGLLQVGAWTVDGPSGGVALRGHAYAATAGTVSADIAYTGSNYFVTAAETSSGIVLSGWTVNASGTPVETTTLVVGAGSQPRVVNPEGVHVVVAYLDPSKRTQLRSYKVANGFTLASSMSIAVSADDLALASSKTSLFGSTYDLMVASHVSNGTELDTYDIDSSTGALTHDTTFANTVDLHHISLAASSFARYALSGLDPTTNELEVLFWSTSTGIAFQQWTHGYGDAMAGGKVARLGGDGVSALTIGRDANNHVRLSTWNVDPTMSPTPAVRMGDADDGNVAFDVAVTPVIDSAAATSYLVAEGVSGQVKLRVWRVGVK